MKRFSNSQTITVVEEKVLEKSKNTLYLVLRQKGFADEIIEKVNEEIEKRLEQYLNGIIDKLKDMKFDNPEEALKWLLLKQLIIILEDMYKEKMLNLCEGDKKIIFDILNDKGEENKEKKP